MATRSGNAPTEVKSAARALEVLEYLADRGSASFAQIIDDLKLPRSSAHGLLQTLESRGWVDVSDADRKLRLGISAWQVGQAFDGHQQVVAAAQPAMDELVVATGETVQLARLDGTENVYIGISVSPHPMRMMSRVGMRLEAHGTGIGKALLSTLSDDEVRQRYHRHPLERFTAKTVSDVDELVGTLDTARGNGYAVDDEEYVEGCRCLAMPLTRIEETGFASALSVTMPTTRTTASWPSDLIAPLGASVADIRGRLGLQ